MCFSFRWETSWSYWKEDLPKNNDASKSLMESVYSSSKTNYTCRLQPLDFPVITKFWLNDIFSAWCFQLNKLKTSIKSSPSILLVGPTSMATPPLAWWFVLVEGGIVFFLGGAYKKWQFAWRSWFVDFSGFGYFSPEGFFQFRNL